MWKLRKSTLTPFWQIFREITVLLKKLLNSWFDEFFFSVRVNFCNFHTVQYLRNKWYITNYVRRPITLLQPAHVVDMIFPCCNKNLRNGFLFPILCIELRNESPALFFYISTVGDIFDIVCQKRGIVQSNHVSFSSQKPLKENTSLYVTKQINTAHFLEKRFMMWKSVK